MERVFRYMDFIMPDGLTCEAPVLIDNEIALRPYKVLLFVRTAGVWRFICEYWEAGVAKAQSELYAMNPQNDAISIAPYPKLTQEDAKFVHGVMRKLDVVNSGETLTTKKKAQRNTTTGRFLPNKE